MKIAYLDEDAGLLFQRIIDSLPKGRGRITLREGVYHLETPVRVERPTSMVLEGARCYSIILLYEGPKGEHPQL